MAFMLDEYTKAQPSLKSQIVPNQTQSNITSWQDLADSTNKMLVGYANQGAKPNEQILANGGLNMNDYNNLVADARSKVEGSNNSQPTGTITPTNTTPSIVQQMTPTQNNSYTPQQSYAKDNSALYTQMYDSALQSTISRIKEAVAKGKSQQQGIIEKAPQIYNPLKDQVSYQGERNLQNTKEMLSNQGQQGGVNRTEMTQVNTATENNINDLNMQQQNLINDANKAIADLESQGLFDEAQATADNANQRLQALIQESNRVDETNYGRLRDYVGDTRYADETSYNRNRDTIGDTRYADETSYNRLRDQVGDTRYTDETQYNRGRDTIADTGKLADGTYTQAGQANLTNEQIRQADLEEKTNPNSVTNQLAKLGLDTAKLNYAALPTQIKNEAQILAQNVQKGVIDVKVANEQLKELTNPNSVTNQMNKLGLQTAKLNYAALPAQLKGEADKLAQDLQAGRINIATAQAQLNNVRAKASSSGGSYSSGSSGSNSSAKPPMTVAQIGAAKMKIMESLIQTDPITKQVISYPTDDVINKRFESFYGFSPTSTQSNSRLANQVQAKEPENVKNTAVKLSANATQLYSEADSVPSTNRQKWYNEYKTTITKALTPSELSAFKSKYKLK
mgnify:FL=1